MLLCAIDEVEPGMMTGASVLHPGRPELELLAADTTLTAAVINRLKQLGVPQVWVACDGTEDLDSRVGESLTLAQREVYASLKREFSATSRAALSTANLQEFRQTIMSLVCDVIASESFAGLGARLFATEGKVFAHSASVAYLSVLIGFSIESYVVRERPRLSHKDAADWAGLGLAGMLHDIGKTGGSEALASSHETSLPPDDDGEAWPDGYADHTRAGYKLLEDCRAPASTRQAVLMHHQRWDGSGWPEMHLPTANTPTCPSGSTIHVFSRIVAAANVLDNLLTGTSGGGAALRALAEFASARFDGWFDPVVRRATLRAVPPFAVGSKVTLSDGVCAVVVSPNRDAPCLPGVRALDARENIDLSAPNETRHIIEAGGEDVRGVSYELPSMTQAIEDRSDAA